MDQYGYGGDDFPPPDLLEQDSEMQRAMEELNSYDVDRPHPGSRVNYFFPLPLTSSSAHSPGLAAADMRSHFSTLKTQKDSQSFLSQSHKNGHSAEEPLARTSQEINCMDYTVDRHEVFTVVERDTTVLPELTNRRP